MGQKVNNGQINTTQKIKVWATRTLLKTGGNLWWVTSYWYFWLLTFFRLHILQIASHILWYLINEERICLWLRQTDRICAHLRHRYSVNVNLVNSNMFRKIYVYPRLCVCFPWCSMLCFLCSILVTIICNFVVFVLAFALSATDSSFPFYIFKPLSQFIMINREPWQRAYLTMT